MAMMAVTMTTCELPKNPLDITELDAERLFDQWEESDDVKLPTDELPAHKRQPQVKLPESMDNIDPSILMKMSKKGKTAMAFVTVDGTPTKQETEMLTERWQVGLTNNHMRCERFVIDTNRAIFVFEDGSLAYEAVDYLTSQPELKEYSIDNQPFKGKGYQKRQIREEL